LHAIHERIEDNLKKIRARMARALERAGRPAGSVRLVAVTKAVGIDEARVLYDLGLRDFGENRVEIGKSKIEALGSDICWHMIGSLQRRKARDAVALFDTIDSVDRIELAAALNERCREREQPLPVLIEVNVSGEEAKHGFAPEAAPQVIDEIRAMEHIDPKGLMTMAPLVEDPEDARPVFAGLRKLGERLGLPELSMGMTNDYEVAIEEGATQVRIGSALFAQATR
jgi:PLP dependent protein